MISSTVSQCENPSSKPLVAENDVKFSKSSTSHYSRLFTENYSHTWKMNDFNEVPFVSKYPVSSPSFVLGKRSDTLWQVNMTKHMHVVKEQDSDAEYYDDDEGEDVDPDFVVELRKVVEQELPEADSAKDGDHSAPEEKPEKIRRLGFRLVKVNDDTSGWDFVKYSFTLKTPDGYTISTKPREEPGDINYEGRPMYAYLTEKDFGDRDIFLEKILHVVCDITYKYIKGQSCKIPELYNITSKFKLLYNSMDFSDVILMARGAKFFAHKNILCARAPGFENLLEDCKDTVKQKLNLNVDEEVGKTLVNFIYGGSSLEGFPLEKCPQLFEAAETYGVSNLKRMCSDYFKKNLDAKVCRDCLGMAENLDDDLGAIRKLGTEKVKRILSKEMCPHKTSA